MQLLTLRSQRGKACCLALSSAPVLVRLLCIHDRSNEARKPQFIGTGEYELWIWLQQIPQYKISRYLMSYQQRGGNKRGILFSDTTLDLFISEAKASALRYFAGAVACASDAEIESLSPGSTARHHPSVTRVLQLDFRIKLYTACNLNTRHVRYIWAVEASLGTVRHCCLVRI